MSDRLIVILFVLSAAVVPFSNGEIALAQIIQGEANHQFMHGSYTGAYCVGWVARNRLETNQYGPSYAEIQGGFNGTISDVPQWEYLMLARRVMNGKEDPTGGALYVFSQQDVDRLRFDESKATLVIRASEHRALIFFAEWPEVKP